MMIKRDTYVGFCQYNEEEGILRDNSQNRPNVQISVAMGILSYFASLHVISVSMAIKAIP